MNSIINGLKMKSTDKIISDSQLNRTVYSLDLNIVRVDVCLTSSGRLLEVPDFRSIKLKRSSTLFSPDSGHQQETTPWASQRIPVGSYGSNMSEMYFRARPWRNMKKPVQRPLEWTNMVVFPGSRQDSSSSILDVLQLSYSSFRKPSEQVVAVV